MKRALAMMVPLLLVLPACSGDDNGPLGGATDRRVDAVEQSADPDDVTATGDAPTGDRGSSYCSMARAFDDDAAAFDVFGGMDGGFDPRSIRDTLDDAAEALRRIQTVAPDELRSDYAIVARGFERFTDELAAADFNLFALDPAALEGFGTDMDAASRRIEAYDREVCGIDRSPGEFAGEFPGDVPFDPEELGIDLEAFLDGFDLDGLDLGALLDGFDLDAFDLDGFDLDGFDLDGFDTDAFDLDGLDLDLDGFDLGDLGGFGDFLQEQMIQGFLADGYSRADAECLATSMLDFDVFSDIDLTDPGSFENFEDPFTRCGVEP